MKLTDRIVAGLPVPAKGNKRVPDSEVKGFNAQVTATGDRGFVLRYRIHGVERLDTIGGFPTWSTAAARTRAKTLRQMIDQGIDPRAREAAERERAMTLAEFWAHVYEPLHVVSRRPSWARDVRSMMTNDILPRLGGRAVADMDHADIAALHRAITKRGAPSRANRVKALVSHMMGFAELPHVADNGERVPALRAAGSNPARGVALNAEDRRERFLTPAEIARLADTLEKRTESVSVALVRFLLLTGARFGEAANATWAQFDLDTGTWRKPSAHTKQKKEHVVPLSAPARALLQQLRDAATGQFLFPGPTGGPITTIKTFWRSVTRQARLDGVRIHDLRHSFASVLAAGGASLPLIGSLLGHTQAATTQRYAHLIDDVQREAVERAGAVMTGRPFAEVVLLSRGGR